MLLPDGTPDWLRSLIANAVGFVMMAVIMTVLWYLLGVPLSRYLYSLPKGQQWLALGVFMAICLGTLAIAAIVTRARRRY